MSYTGTYRPRTPNIRLLDASIRIKNRRRLRHASIAIVGIGQTGKKTLARRFGAMNQGPFEEEVQSRYYYMAYVDLDTRHTNGTGDVFIRSYVVPPPLDLPREVPPLYFRDVYNFSAVIFLCSVIDRGTFEEIFDIIHELRLGLYRNGLPYYLIVGNKMDLDRNIYPLHFTYTYGLLTTQYNLGVNYEECSAKQNINVDVILEEILLRIIADEP
ncbi:hypothetical protein AVEN_161858-1 [Araneus ventricosus]|uniref:GTP-binding protein Rheb n=1 Tax=Araneus ventricosus TaxID=182803 RepID=A0A4Y2VMC1_ARAVE|nr:hypothetical protein AVEN_190263-1 [Araneus ventricosus]GBO24952.1 hypothetical protein AVEN_161858-1 [Araneus ventricosus]